MGMEAFSFHGKIQSQLTLDLRINSHRLGIILWFFKRPRLYKQLVRELMSFSIRTTHPTLQKSVEAEDLCEKLAVSEKDGFHKMFPDQDYVEISQIHSSAVREAEETIRLKDFNWGGQGNMSLNYNLAEAAKARNILETGVAYGWSSLSFLLSLENRNVGRLVSVDMPFFGVEDESEVGCAVPEKLKSRWFLISLPDKDGLPKVFKQMPSIDICHYDSDKSYDGKKWAFPKIWKNLKKDGLLISDDISDNMAFFEFAESISSRPIVLKTFDTQVEKFVGILKKS
jgi:predicted O-methyltransferase YrrM